MLLEIYNNNQTLNLLFLELVLVVVLLVNTVVLNTSSSIFLSSIVLSSQFENGSKLLSSSKSCKLRFTPFEAVGESKTKIPFNIS